MKTMLMAIAMGALGIYSLKSKTIDKLLGKQCSRQLRDPHV